MNGFGFARRLRTSPVLSALLAGACFAAAAMVSSPAAADIENNSCGAPIKSTSRTMLNSEFSTKVTGYANVTYGWVTVVVPSGQTQCVTVRFSATASCVPVNAGDYCFLRANDTNSFVFDPTTTFSASVPSALSFEWTTRLSQGTHLIRIQAGGGPGAATFTLYNWVLTTTVSK